MECNKDEALRAKLIAEGKLERKDFAGAKKFALKAKALYPGLDGISQMLTALDVYVAAENKIAGEIDWYGVLGVKPSDDDETMKKQYRKLALALHPDKNKSVGADGAFKLTSEAWSLLSDRAKRLAYNQRRSYGGFQQKGQTYASGPSAPSKENGIFNFASKMTSLPKTKKNGTNVPRQPTPPSYQRNDTFWTICHRCKMHYEYLRKYLNHTLLCPTCHEAFTASETAPPFHFYNSSNQVPRQRQRTSNNHRPTQDVPVPQKAGPGQAGSNSFAYSQYEQDMLSGITSVGTAGFSVAAKSANAVQQAQNKSKRAYTESRAYAGRDGCVKRKKLDDDSSRCGGNYNVSQGNGGFGTASGNGLGTRVYDSYSTSYRSNSRRDLNPVEVRKLLIERARKVILNKLNMQRSETTAKALNKEEDTSKESKQVRNGTTANTKGVNQNGNNDLSAAKVADQPGEDRPGYSMDNSSEEDPAAVTMTVPDPDFYDFDQDRSESSFGDNEVWASYDDDDGMPRFYALVSKVISRKPFQLRISWLNSKTNTEFSTIDWVDKGFYKTCGEFRVGRYETCKTINSFSQKVKWSKGPRGSILIFPQKGDVWALYKNWSSDWNEHTPDEIIHKYDMATVLDDYNEEWGISVAPLVKVVGFKAVFRPNMNPEVFKRIPREEMFRFSHRVPYQLLTGQEAPNAPKGCFELDPAATPLELLQVITESNTNQTTADKEALH